MSLLLRLYWYSRCISSGDVDLEEMPQFVSVAFFLDKEKRLCYNNLKISRKRCEDEKIIHF